MPVAATPAAVLKARHRHNGEPKKMNDAMSNPSGPPRSHELWARFRFSVIGPLLAAPPERGELQEQLKSLALNAWAAARFEVGVEDAMAALDRLLGVFDRFVETPEAEFSVGAQIEPLAHRRVARTEQHGLLDIGFGLLKTAQIVLRVASQRQQPSGVRINRKPGV